MPVASQSIVSDPRADFAGLLQPGEAPPRQYVQEAGGFRKPLAIDLCCGLGGTEEGFNCTLARELAPSLKGLKYNRTDEDRRQHLSIARKAASAKIAKIPFALSSWIAKTYRPADRPILSKSGEGAA